jgi:two-component system, chemotaxis family, chemotaxis protein CheY
MKNKTQPAGMHQLRVLIVEDNEHMRSLLRALLLALGIRQIFECSEGSEGLKLLSERRPDIVLTDLSMAPMDGLTFTQEVRRLPSDNDCVVPIIMVTGHTERRRVEAARDAGVNEILVKPVTPSGLYQRIEEIIMRPRPFVRAPNYCGPCRRRRNNPDYAGPWRRASDGDLNETVAVDAPEARAAPTEAAAL